LFFIGRPFSFLRNSQLRYGNVFTLHLAAPGLAQGPIVYLADPGGIKELFALDGSDGHAGIANSVLEPLTGPQSLLLMDHDDHLRERRLLSPAFHGNALQSLEGVIYEATERELTTWGGDEVFALRPAMQRITFDVIARAVMGVEDPCQRDLLLAAFDPIFNISAMQTVGLAPTFRVDLGPWSPWGRLRRSIDRLDHVLLGLIAERRVAEPREDILGLLLAASDADGHPLSDRHVRDELVTLLIAGHETTATALAWALERLAHNPAVFTELRQGLAGGDEQAVEAVAAETLRVRPVVMDVARHLSSEAEVGGYRLPAGTTVMPSIYLVQLDAKNHPKPDEFCPERFRDQRPSVATWLPFGGGRRRCIGAGLAQMEMRIVLDRILREFVPEAVSSPEAARLRGITFVPKHDARLRMRRAPI
jgi:cytochrome P450